MNLRKIRWYWIADAITLSSFVLLAAWAAVHGKSGFIALCIGTVVTAGLTWLWEKLDRDSNK